MKHNAVNVAQLQEFDEIVDVRSPSEYALDHIPGAINAPYEENLDGQGTFGTPQTIVTFEAVGNRLLPGFDVAEVAKPHVSRVILERFSPLRLGRESLTAVPELVDALAKTPRLLSEGLRLIERVREQVLLQTGIDLQLNLQIW